MATFSAMHRILYKIPIASMAIQQGSKPVTTMIATSIHHYSREQLEDISTLGLREEAVPPLIIRLA